MCSVRNAVPFLVCNLDAFVLTLGLCFVLFVFEYVMFLTSGLLNNFKKRGTFGSNDNLNRSLCPPLQNQMVWDIYGPSLEMIWEKLWSIYV